ncbi:MAG TPA: S8 family serine peptidase, partial [Chloroflexota bacterium]|nr:S8 family serine peptidase [Chloroflexota bacterium]
MPGGRPAYSSQFAPDAVPLVRRMSLLDEISPEWAWGGGTGTGVKVAVIDSGIEADHPAVGGVDGYVSISEGPDGLLYDGTPHLDSYGHGTACAGIIRSLAPQCQLYSVKVLGAGLTGKGIVFAAGLRWAIENGMHIANLSLGTTKKDFYGLFHELADLAYFRNLLLVTAANNLPIPSFPSVYASVISVASHEVPDPFRIYYNPAPPVNFGAYGINVRVPWLNGSSITSTGNSFAAPHITGLAARILGKHPDLTVFHMQAVLRALSANLGERPPEQVDAE